MDAKKTFAAVAVVLVALAAAFAALGGIVMPRAEVTPPVPAEAAPVEGAAPIGVTDPAAAPAAATTETPADVVVTPAGATVPTTAAPTPGTTTAPAATAPGATHQ